jgi:hypothetical protein
MSETPPEETIPTLDDVIEPTESAPRDRTGHGKQPPRLDDDELAHRAEQERVALGIDEYDPDDVPSATE